MSGRTGFAPAIAWGGLVAVALLAAWVRYGWIEPAEIARQCAAATAPAWCGVRQWLVQRFLDNSYGIAALAMTALALLWRRSGTAWCAAALGFVALQLYCFQSGAMALLIGCLLLVRQRGDTVAATPPGQQQRRGEHQVHPQP
jgi:hypothetical protein